MGRRADLGERSDADLPREEGEALQSISVPGETTPVAAKRSATRELALPQFLVIGAMRSGTTSLWVLLRRHRRIFLPVRKELHFFDDRDGNFGRGAEWYASHFARDRVGGECSPSYLFVEGTAERINSLIPEARLVAILRDPVERAWSHYWFSVCRGREPLSFAAALDREPKRLASGDLEQQISFSYASRGRYVEQLRRYEQVFSREQLCVVFLEELLADPASVMTTVLAHIGLEVEGTDLSLEPPSKNRGIHPRSRRLHYAMRGALRWSEEQSTPLAAPVRGAVGAVRRVNLTSGIPRIPQRLRADLAERFRDSDRELAVWLGRDLPWIPGAEGR